MKPTMRQLTFAICLSAGGLQAHAVTIDFDDLTPGTVLANQYAALGVSFSANAFSGPNSNSTVQGWATNTDLTIVSSNGPLVGLLGEPALVSGNVLHSFGATSPQATGWQAENGDPSFRIGFASPITSISATFAGVSFSAAAGADVTLVAYDGATLLGTVAGAGAPATQQFSLNFSAARITSVAITPGSFDDWVAVDNIVFQPASSVPEAPSAALLSIGLGVLGWRRRARS